MNNPPPSSPEANKTFKGQKCIGLLAGLFLVAGAGYFYGKNFINKQLSPLISKELANIFNRPVKIGQLKGISLNHLEFGASQILPTKNDPAQITIPKVIATFDPWQALTQRRLEINVEAFNPEVYLEQSTRGDWLVTPLTLPGPGKNDLIKPEFKTLHIDQGKVTLRARNSQNLLNPPLQLNIKNGQLQLKTDKDSVIDYNLSAFIGKGNLQLSGTSNLNSNLSKIKLTSSNLPAQQIAKLLPVSLALTSGELASDLQVQFQPNKPLALAGSAQISQVMAKLPQLAQPISNIQGSVKFVDSSVVLGDGITAEFGNIKSKIKGIVDLVNGYNLTLQSEPFVLKDTLDTLKIKVSPLKIKGSAQAQVKVTGELNRPELALSLYSTKNATQIDKIALNKFQITGKLVGSDVALQNWQAVAALGGQLSGNGGARIASGKNPASFNLNFKAQDIPADTLAKLYALALPVKIGIINAQGQIKGKLVNQNQLKLTAQVQSKLLNGDLNLKNIEYDSKHGSWQTQLKAENIQPNITKLPKSKANADLYIKGNLGAKLVRLLQIKGNAQVLLPQGKINLPSINAQYGKWRANLTTEQLSISALNLPVKGSVKANIWADGSLEKIQETLKAQGNAEIILDKKGTFKVERLSLQQGNWKAKIKANDIAINSFVAQIPGQIKANLDVSGLLKEPIKSLNATGSALLTSKQGQIELSQIALKGDQWQTQAQLKQLQLASISPQLRGKLNGRVNLRGSLSKLNLQSVKAQGDLKFSQGISVVDYPIEARFAWQGKRLELAQVNAKNLNIQGYLDIDSQKINQGISSLGNFSLDITARNLNLQKLSLPATLATIKKQGSLDFIGNLKGNLKEPQLSGDIALKRFVFGPVILEPVLTGRIQANPRSGANLKLSGKKDRIIADLDSKFQLQNLDLQLEPLKLTASQQSKQINIKVKYLSLAWLKEFLQYSPVSTNIQSVALAGDFSGDFKINLAKKELLSQNIQITNPVLGIIRGNIFAGQISFLDGNFTLKQGIFKINKSQYELEGLLKTKEDFAFKFNTKTKDANIQNTLEALQIFEFADLAHVFSPPVYAKAQALYTDKQSNKVPLFDLGKSDATVIYQLRRYSEIKTIYNLEQEKNKKNFNLPELSKLKGNFDAQLSVAGSLTQPINAQFSFAGQKWQWEKYAIEEILAEGEFQNGSLELKPVKIQAGDSLLSFAGKIDSYQQTGELKLLKIPLSLLNDFLNLPANLNFAGLLNADLSLAGNRYNPKAKGTVDILDGMVNQTPLKSAQAQFSYNDSVLNFSANSTLSADTPPITLEGKFPYQLPFVKKAPLTNNFALNVNVRDNGLMLLNILTSEELRWLSGRGSVDVSIHGSFDHSQNKFTDLKADGLIELSNGSLAAQFVPDQPITGINGKISLDFDHIDVQELNAKFSGSQIKIAGTLPLTRASLPVTKPLRADFDGLAFNLKGLYKGGLRGQLTFIGTALNPHIGGNIELSNGQILLGSLIGESVQNNVSIESGKISTSVVEFDNLELSLKDKVQLNQFPVLSFDTSGTLTLNGTLDQPHPVGTIKLKGGLVNLFTTQFRLGGGEDNTATFSPNHGLDPYLKIRLYTSAAETQRNLIRTDSLSSEINNPFTANIDGLQTVRIEAKVDGYASDLERSIELTSVPARSQVEIISLLGGGGDPTIGLANLASSAILGSFQETLRSTLGFSQFRVFPTQLINQQDRTGAAQMGIAAEVGVDLSPSIYFSAQQILNIQRPTQFGLRYSINDNLYIRGSSNFSDDSRAVLQYEIRF
ncbi:MAG: translocation/assembly module TamB domain-containing protein [Cyanobacteriota bacterium ELA615]